MASFNASKLNGNCNGDNNNRNSDVTKGRLLLLVDFVLRDIEKVFVACEKMESREINSMIDGIV